MRYIIYGAGAVGGAIGAQLHRDGHEVVLIARGEHLARLRGGGLRLRTPDFDERLTIETVGAPSEIAFGPDDVVLLAMKSQDTAAALEELRNAAGDVAVICAQNGVENERMASRLFTRVYGMVVWMAATMIEPGEIIIHASPPAAVLDCGRYPTGTDALIDEVAEALTVAGFSARSDPAVMRLKYGKLLTNLINALQAMLGLDVDSGELLSEAREEALACYAAAGVDSATREELRERTSVIRAGEVADLPRFGGSSWQSLARGQTRIEIDYLNGEIVLLGRLHGVPVPVNLGLQQAASRAATEGAAPGSMTLDELNALVDSLR